MHFQLLVPRNQEFDWPISLSFSDHGGVITHRLMDIPMVQGLGDRNSLKYLHDDIILVIQAIGRGFNTGGGLVVKKKRETLQNQIPSFGSNLRNREFTGCLVTFSDEGT
jgi:hypothetical protein